MTLNYIHKPNYFFFAQRLIHFINQTIIHKKPSKNTEIFALSEIYTVFTQDLAATTANLESILNIAEQYYVGDDPKQTLICAHHINAELNTVLLEFNSISLEAIQLGSPIHAPDAAA